MKSGGFVLTLDVTVALIVAAFLITMILYFVSAPKLDTQGYLYSVCDDFLAVAAKDGSLQAATSGDVGQADGFLHSMPDNLCLNLTISDAGGVSVYERSSCPIMGNFVICKRTLVNGTNDYVSKLRVWYR
jgi:hypothetical protein